MNKSGLFSTIRFIEDRDYDRIHQASVKILKETGVVFQSDDAVEIFKKHGAKVDGQRVYIAEDMVNKALSPWFVLSNCTQGIRNKLLRWEKISVFSPMPAPYTFRILTKGSVSPRLRITEI